MIISSLKTYSPKSIPNDLLAGLVIAALSIPISMGYAQVAGLPAIYGLWASIIAPLAFAIFTSTRKVVFGMDSAAIAMTASMLALVGVSSSNAAIAAMPVLTLFAALFLVLFRAVGAGKLLKMIPVPVVHGFIFGIAITVIVGQLPDLLGLSVSLSGSVPEELGQLAAVLSDAAIPVAAMGIGAVLVLSIIARFLPSIPAPIVILALCAGIATALSAFTGISIPCLAPIDGSIPQIADFPATFAAMFFPAEGEQALNIGALAAAGFAIAVVIALESTLCIEAFAADEPDFPDPEHELSALGFSNVAVAAFGCPPASASMSRTAAGISSGAASQLAGVFSAAIICLVCLFAGTLMSYLPECALAAIVIVALLGIVDWTKIGYYMANLRADFLVFCVSAGLVMAFGAIAGILGGILIAIAFKTWQAKMTTEDDFELLGTIPHTMDTITKDEGRRLKEEYNACVVKVPSALSFSNIAPFISNIENKAIDHDVIILKMSKLDDIDSTAAEKLEGILRSLKASGKDVQLVRKIRETRNHVTRVMLRRLLAEYETHACVRDALAALDSHRDRLLNENKQSKQESKQDDKQGKDKHENKCENDSGESDSGESGKNEEKNEKQGEASRRTRASERTSEERAELHETSAFAKVTKRTIAKVVPASLLPAPLKKDRGDVGGGILGEKPVVTVWGIRDLEGRIAYADMHGFLEDIRGKLDFVRAGRTYIFQAQYAAFAKEHPEADPPEGEHMFSQLVVYRASSGKVILDYHDGDIIDTTVDDESADAIIRCMDAVIAVALVKLI